MFCSPRPSCCKRASCWTRLLVRPCPVRPAVCFDWSAARKVLRCESGWGFKSSATFIFLFFSQHRVGLFNCSLWITLRKNLPRLSSLLPIFLNPPLFMTESLPTNTWVYPVQKNELLKQFVQHIQTTQHTLVISKHVAALSTKDRLHHLLQPYCEYLLWPRGSNKPAGQNQKCICCCISVSVAKMNSLAPIDRDGR